MPSTRRSDSANAQKPESTSDPTAEHQCRFQFCIERFQSIRRLFLQLSDSRLAPARTSARHEGGRAPTRSAARGLWGQTRWRNKGALQAFFQASPKVACFAPSFSKQIFGGFV